MSVRLTDLKDMLHQSSREMDEAFLVFAIKVRPRVEKRRPLNFFQRVTREIEKILCPCSIERINHSIRTLYALREKGVLAVWDDIQEVICKEAQKMPENLSANQALEAAKTMVLDMESLVLYLADQIEKIDLHHELSHKIVLAMRIAIPSERLFSPAFFSELTKTPRKKLAPELPRRPKTR